MEAMLKNRPQTTIAQPTWATVREIKLTDLRSWPDNPRTIRPERLEQLKQALGADRDMLWARPLIALPDGTVFSGNQRLRAATELGWKTIPVVTVDLDADQARLWALRDNNSYGEWDEPALAEILAGLESSGVDLALSGFADRDLDRILAHLTPPADPDDAPDLRTGSTRSQPGEVYELGGHRLLCGDATDHEQLALLLGDTRPELLWTDPPYGVNYVGKTRRALTIANDGSNAIEVFQAAIIAADRFLGPSARFYVCVPGGSSGTGFRLALTEVGWHLHQSLVWVKNSIVIGHGDHQAQHEEILYGWTNGPGRPGRGRHKGSRWYGGNNASTVFFVDRPSRSEQHPTMKPIALIGAQLSNSSLRGDAVLDLFAGSGSTLIACEQLGRRCFAVEIDPAYCDVIRDRYEAFTRG